MSGIAGIIRFDGGTADPALAEAMISSMARRGPDRKAYWHREGCALGHCMLQTTPESLEENQPLADEAGRRLLVLDGRIDNWEELRRELSAKGAVLRTRADAELVLRSFETWGADCVRHLDGDFAFVVWDRVSRAAFCARDRIGNKPLHYHWNGRIFAFASEAQALLALPWVDPVLNEGVFAEFLAADWFSLDETLWTGVLRLVAAHRATVDSLAVRLERYWEPDLWAKLPCKRDEEYVEHYRELLFDRIRRMSRSHRPVTCHVSGGLDSSAVFAVAHRLQREGRLLAPGLEGRSLAFPGQAEADELSYSRAVGRHLGVVIHEDPPTRLLPESWYEDWARAAQGNPGFPNSTMFLGLMQAASSAGSKVLLTGQGGDEWNWTPYHTLYAEALSDRDWRGLWQSLRADVGAYGPAKALYWLLRHGAYAQLPGPVQRMLRRMRRVCAEVVGPRPREPEYWLAPRMMRLVQERRARAWHEPGQPLRRLGQRGLLQRLYGMLYAYVYREHNEQFHAWNGLENRDPLYSASMVQFAFSLPDRFRRRGLSQKFLHVQAMAGLLPPEVIARRDKAEFCAVTFDHIDRLGDGFSAGVASNHPDWVTPEGARALQEAYRGAARSDTSTYLWALYVCEIFGRVLKPSRGLAA